MGYNRDDIVAVYTVTFTARTDVYSQWTPDGWRPVRKQLEVPTVIAALMGEVPSLSGYMIATNSTSNVLAVDFDSEIGLIQATDLGRSMWKNDIPAYVETSRRGAHLWCALDDSVPAVTIRRAIRALLLEAGLPDDDPKIELRPGSDEIPESGLGHCLRMPLMPHPKTGKKGDFLDPRTERPLAKTLGDIITHIDLATTKQMTDWASLWSPTIGPNDIPKEYRRPRPPYRDDNLGTASEILRDRWGVLDARPGKAVRCPAHEDKVPSLSILKDDERAICFSPVCELHNGGHGRGTYELTQMAPRS